MFDRLKLLLRRTQESKPVTTLGLGNLPLDRGASVQIEEVPHVNRKEAAPQTLPVLSGGVGVSFAVDDVVPASDPLWQTTLAESTEMRVRGSILIQPNGETPALAPEGYAGKPVSGEPRKPLRTIMPGLVTKGSVSIARQIAARHSCLHPLIEAVHLTFSDHRPLILSPDCIWLTIAQGFGHHVHENAEALRWRLVRHAGKKKLQVTTNSLSPDRWPSLISQFSSQIRDNTDPVLHETLVCEFSTTTPNIRTAYEVALMDTYERYFDYGMMCVCGIPRVFVQGTADDWQRIRERIEVLATYDLEWWISRVRPVIDQFVETAKGNPDRAFWQAIYKPQKAYAAELASGWIGDLFPYLFGSPRSQGRTFESRSGWRDAATDRNPVLAMPRTDWLLPVATSPMVGNGVNLKNFPSGLSKVPVKVTLPGGIEQELQLAAGFLGVSQREEDYALAPIVSWAVAEENN